MEGFKFHAKSNYTSYITRKMQVKYEHDIRNGAPQMMYGEGCHRTHAKEQRRDIVSSPLFSLSPRRMGERCLINNLKSLNKFVPPRWRRSIFPVRLLYTCTFTHSTFLHLYKVKTKCCLLHQNLFGVFFTVIFPYHGLMRWNLLIWWDFYLFVVFCKGTT